LEIWFETDVPEEAIYGLAYQRLTKDFPTSSVLPAASIPAEARNMNPALLHLPHFRFERKDLAVLVGPKNVAIGMLGGYPKWAAWSASLRHALSVIKETGIKHSALQVWASLC
jgi:uncharacterized protein (TIGR04255 family)